MHFKTNRTNEETSKWMNSQKNLSLQAGFEEANTFFGTFPRDHKTFGTWQESFLQKEKKIKNEAQQRLMKEVGGSRKQYYTPVRFFLVLRQPRLSFYLQMTFAVRVQGGLVVVLSIQHFRLLVILVKTSTVSICSLKVTWWFYGYLNDGKYDKIAGILMEGDQWWWWWWTPRLFLACLLKPCSLKRSIFQVSFA